MHKPKHVLLGFFAILPLVSVIGFSQQSLSSTPGRSLHLISLSPEDDSYSSPSEALLRKCWKWKDSVLGDGRDYFVPKPKSLKAFQSLFVGMEIGIHGTMIQNNDPEGMTTFRYNTVTMKQPQSSTVILFVEQPSTSEPLSDGVSVSNSYVIEECVTLSNCARFEMLFVLKSNNTANSALLSDMETKMAESAAKLCMAYQLFRQTEHDRSNTFLRSSGLSSWMDLPNVVLFETNTANASSSPKTLTLRQSKAIAHLEQRLMCITGYRPVSHHLSLVASGLAPRTNRPDRNVVFRPYSSRDAHIMLQLKRTAEVVTSCRSNAHEARGGPSPIIKIVLEGALTAGKAARNDQIVPDIRRLREFGSDGTPPVALANVVAEAAIRLAVLPAVDKCVERFKAAEASRQIVLLRARTNDIVDTLGTPSQQYYHELQKLANTLLHAPTMQLREGKRISDSELEDTVHEIELELKAYMVGLRSKLKSART